MKAMLSVVFPALLATWLSACGGGMTPAGTTTASGGGGAGGQSSSSSSSSSSSTSSSSSSSSSSSGSTGLATLGSLVVLGGSISDGGGEGPFYYDLLRADLATKYGAITYENAAEAGAKTNKLITQINGLPSVLPGPVAVVITSGGNDMMAALPEIVAGTDDAARAEMNGNLGAALDALLAINRFGLDVEVHVYQANIYDASDGAGDYSLHGCGFGQGLPTTPSDGFFAAWNGVIHDQVIGHQQAEADVHGHFLGHGYTASPSWYAPDCAHPSKLGHAEIERLFYQAITGSPLP